MLSGADLRQALQAGLWEALADGSDCGAMRATCRDARDVADELHDTAVLPVGPGTWDSGGAIAAYHRRLVGVRSVHVEYSGGAADEARAAHFMEAYIAALGAALPAVDCSIAMPFIRQLPTPLAAALLQRAVPHVERLDMALGTYGNVVQLLQALEPCVRLCSLRLLLAHAAKGLSLADQDVCIRFGAFPGALEALCRLPRLHTLSGPWSIGVPDLQRLCDALPSLATLGFSRLYPYDGAPGVCISRRLHTLAAWRHSAGHGSAQLDRPWHLQRSSCYCYVYTPCSLLTALPAVRHLDALVLDTRAPRTEDLPAMQAVTQHCAACAGRWAWKVGVRDSEDLQALRGMPPGSLAALRHVIVEVHHVHLAPSHAPADVASALGGLVSAAPNITTLAFCGTLHGFGSSSSAEALAAMMQPLRRAARLRTLWLSYDAWHRTTAAWQAALLEGVVRCLAQPGDEGGDEYCRALQHVLLAGAQPGALAACRAALARDCVRVSVGTCDTYALKW